MSIIFGLGTALNFGIADFFARISSEREGSFRTAFFLHFVGGLVAIIPFLLGARIPWQAVLSPAGLGGVLIGVAAAVGGLFLYRALVLGPMLVVSPIASSAAVVTVTLALLTGERPAVPQLVGMAVTIMGVVFAAASTSNNKTEVTQRRIRLSSGIAFALISAVFLGSSTWLLDTVINELGNFTAILVLRISASFVLFAALLARRRTPRVSSIASFKWLLPMALLDNLATWLLTLGLQTGLTSIVSVTASLFSVVTVLMGYIFLKERISRKQQMGIAVTLVGVALVSV